MKLNLNELSLKKNYYSKLPFNVPVIPAKTDKSIKFKVVSVHGSKILTSNGEKLVNSYSNYGFKDVLNLISSTKGILEFYIKDKQLEGFWSKRKDLYKDIKKLGFEYVITPNFSLYSDSTRIEHLYNIKRNEIVYNEFLDNGINSIPDLSWFNKKDLERRVKEINKNKIKIIAYSFQNVGVKLKSSTDWKYNLIGLKFLCENIKHKIDIVISGIASPYRIIDIYKVIGKKNRLIILNQTAFIQSRKAILSESQDKNYDLSFDEIFSRNIDYYNKIYKEIYESNRLSDIYYSKRSKLLNVYEDIKNSDDKILINFTKRFLKRRRIKF
jgi:hypothetical protein